MNVTWLVFFMFALSIGLWLTGFQSGMADVMHKYETNKYTSATTGDIDFTLIMQDIASNIFTWNNLLLTGVLVAAVLTSGLNLLALIPLAAIMLVVQFIFIPVKAINEAGLPSEVNVIITGFFTLLEILTIFMLIRGNFR